MAPTQLKQVGEMSNQELRAELQQRGINIGPITDSTRRVYEKKLEDARNPTEKSRGGSKSPTRAQHGGSAGAASSLKRSSSSTTGGRGGSPTKRTVAEQSSVSANVSMNSSEGGGGVVKRTPTPPRAASGKKQTTSTQIFPAHTTSGGSNGPTTAASRSPFNETDGWTEEYNDDGDYDDHMETSRLLPQVFKPSLSSTRTSSLFAPNGNGSPSHYFLRGSSNTTSGNRLSSAGPVTRNGVNSGSGGRYSLSGKLKDAWGFFSRPMGQATPCSTTAGAGGFMPGASKYARHSPTNAGYGSITMAKQRSSPAATTTAGGSFFDVPGWILFFLGLFVLGLAVAYVHHSSPSSIGEAFGRMRSGVKEAGHFLYSYAILPAMTAVLLGASIICAIALWKWRLRAMAEHKRQLMELVERITDEIRDAQQGGGIAETHVRDLLMPPTRRTDKDWQLWGEAARFINMEDSRVRTEVRLINGVECSFWCWAIPTSSPPTGSSRVALTRSQPHQSKWQGAAIPTNSPMANYPHHALTRCMKLRGLKFANRASEKQELQRDLLEQMSPITPIHIHFAVGPPECIVYMMFQTLDNAKKAFDALNSQWYDGTLIAVKYVRDERYAERFPEIADK